MEVSMTDYLLQLDGAALLWIQDNVRNEVLTPFFRFITSLGDHGILWVLLSLALFLYKRTRKVGWMAATALFLALLVDNVLLKNLVARAGEQGKGFAVVAGEIGSLANQSSDAVQSIVDIVKEVQDAVKDMIKCLEQTNGFIEENVIPDYESFLEGSKLYREDADAVRQSMNEINDKINILQKSSQEIATAINDINNTIGEEAQGITDIAQKTTDVVNSSQSVREMVDVTAEYAGQLKDIVEEFIL